MSISELQKRISEKFTDDVLFDILRKKSGCKSVSIRDITFGPLAKKGDSYLSSVTKFSVKAVGQRERSDHDEEFEAHIIVKCIPKNIARRETFRSVDFFNNEIAFYDKVWPSLNSFQQSKNPKEPFKAVPLCLYTYADGTDDFIALEDVSFQGFRDLGRANGLDLDQANVIIRIFAKYHALSLAYKDQHPTEFERMANSVQETYFAEKFRNWYKNTMKNFCTIARDAVEKHLPESYLTKIDECLSQDLYATVSKLCATHGKLAVITHGDCWIPNFLVKFDDNGVTAVDTVVIDYQLARYSSLAQDLLFFLLTCLKRATLKNHWDDLINSYHVAFVEFLKDLGSNENLLTLESLKEDMKRNGVFGFCMCLEAIVMSCLDDEDVADIDMIQGEEAVPLDTVWILRPFKNVEKRQKVADFFKILVDKNLI